MHVYSLWERIHLNGEMIARIKIREVEVVKPTDEAFFAVIGVLARCHTDLVRLGDCDTQLRIYIGNGPPPISPRWEFEHLRSYRVGTEARL